MRKPCEIKAGYIVQDLILVVTFTEICARNKISISQTLPATKMGIIFENTRANCTKVFLVIALLFVLSEVTTAQRKIDCRKFVFAPPCRGIAAKRDTHSHSNEIRLTPSDDSADYIIDAQKPISNDNYAAVNGLLGFLKRTMSKNLEYDTNYLA